MTTRARHLWHVCPTFAIGGREARTAAIMNALGPEFVHTVVALDGDYQAAELLDARIQLRRASRDMLAGRVPAIAHARALKSAAPDLVLTYNWGATDAIVGALGVRFTPLIHMEDGFGPDEVSTLKRRRVLFRRLLLNRIYSTVVPSERLHTLALQSFRIAPSKVRLIPNGVDAAVFRPARDLAWRARHQVPAGALLFGIAARLRPEKNIPLLLEAFARGTPVNAFLGVLGDGPERSRLEGIARALGIANRVIFAGSSSTPARFYAALDVFVMSSATEQRPMALLEAMACGLPIVTTDVGDIPAMLGTTARPVIVPSGDVTAYAAALTAIGNSPLLRHTLGKANRARCVAHHSAERMISDYRNLYEGAIACRRAASQLI